MSFVFRKQARSERMEIREFLLRLEKVKKYSGYWMARCPAHDDRDPSLYVSEENGRIRVKCYAGCSTEEVLRALGLERSDLFIDLPPCNILPDGIPAKWYGKTFVALWPYRDVQGNILGYAVRYENGSGKKDVVPFFKKKNGNKWQAGGPKEPRPLYNLHHLSKDNSKAVIFCEGEKAAEAAQRLLKGRGVVATTTQGGGKAADKTDFSPLRGRVVWIWPDADEPGMKYASNVAKLARKAGAKSIHIIDVKALGFEIGSKKDAADWLRERQLPHPLPILSEDRAPRLLLTPLSEIEPEKVTWLWEPYLAQGKLTLLEGDPGVGKTWIALAICARLTASGHKVIYASCEDGTADTLRPRMDGMSGNLSKFFILQGLQMDNVVEPFNLGQLAYLREVFEEYRPSLLVLDPIQGFLGADVDMHRANEVRSRLAGIMALAEEFSCAVILVRHLNKSNTYRAIYKG
ncbi:MAG TPA: hypothetical protein ENI41_08905, partial [Deltaproteobacteria bacterium]|nr:hypothetical protein [Deltaproteobacteria bacterium]